MKSSLSLYVLRFLERHPNPSPPLPIDPYLLERLDFWPQDSEKKIYLSRDMDLRELFVKIREKWPDALLEGLFIGKETFRILYTEDPRILEDGQYNQTFVTVTKVY